MSDINEIDFDELDEILKRYSGPEEKPEPTPEPTPERIPEPISKPTPEPKVEQEKELVSEPKVVSRAELMKQQRERSQKEAKAKRAAKQKKNKIINKVLDVFLVLFILVFVGSASYLGVYFYKIKKAQKGFDNLKSLVVKESASQQRQEESEGEVGANANDYITYENIDGVQVQSKFVKIYKENRDFVGWLTVDDTEIDLPVMQTKDDEQFYIHRDFDKEYSSSGTLFLGEKSDIRRPSDNMIIYGHNMKAGTMFHDILKYEHEDFYNEHKTFTFDTLEDNGEYEVIAAFRTVIDEESDGFKYYEFFNASDKEAFDEFVTNVKKQTPYEIETTAEYGEKLVTLSTCAYHAREGRYVVVAKKVK